MNEQYYIKNKKQFRNAILEAKGGKRTSKEFAKLCGITEPTFSRYKIKLPTCYTHG